MWPRVVELMLGVWLAASPFFIPQPTSGHFSMINAFVCATIVVIASCLAYWEPTRHARAITAVVALWLVGRAYLAAPHPASPWLQNEFLIGLLLLMFAVIPNEASKPPRSWRSYVRGPKSIPKPPPEQQASS